VPSRQQQPGIDLVIGCRSSLAAAASWSAATARPSGTVPDASFESRDRQAVFVVKGVADAVEQCKGGKVI
jgi:hypothetical protein